MFKRIGDSQDQLFGPCAMPVGPFPIPYLCVQIPGSAMDLPRCHRDIEPVEDCEGMIDAYAGAVQVVLRLATRDLISQAKERMLGSAAVRAVAKTSSASR